MTTHIKQGGDAVFMVEFTHAELIALHQRLTGNEPKSLALEVASAKIEEAALASLEAERV